MEQFGRVLIEAMASGTPVITSNTSSLKEIAEGAAILVDPNNSEELADAMLKLNENEYLRDELSKKGLERVKQFNAQTAAEQVLNIYKQRG
jgi:glycosyltransferase involved in cell wall biosynthesis